MSELSAEDLNKAQIGRIIHYTPSSKLNSDSGDCIPAIVVRSFNNGKVNLKAFPDNPATYTYHLKGVSPEHRFKIRHTWHWPRECENLYENKQGML